MAGKAGTLSGLDTVMGTDKRIFFNLMAFKTNIAGVLREHRFCVGAMGIMTACTAFRSGGMSDTFGPELGNFFVAVKTQSRLPFCQVAFMR